jgi:MinD-like ATPase involved in chromosome partitioning or flagellar assembly
MDESIETRIRAVEFLLAHLLSRTRSIEDIKADRDELRTIAGQGDAWKLMIELTRSQATEVIETAADLLDDALFQANGD